MKKDLSAFSVMRKGFLIYFICTSTVAVGLARFIYVSRQLPRYFYITILFQVAYRFVTFLEWAMRVSFQNGYRTQIRPFGFVPKQRYCDLFKGENIAASNRLLDVKER